MNLPVTVARGYQPGDSPTIFVGAKSLAGSGATLDAIGGAGLKAGDGAVLAFSQGGKAAVAVLGGDDSGLASAAVMLAGHLPYVWDQKGPTTDKIADDVKQFLAGKGVTASSATASAIYTRAGAAGRRRARDGRAADGERRRLREGDGRAEPVQGDQRARRQAAAVVRERARAADPAARARIRTAVDRSAARPRRRNRGRAAAAGAPSRRRREGELRSLDVLRERRRARRLRQQPDSGSRRRAAERGRRRLGRDHRSRGAARARVHRHLAADRADRRRR